MVSRREAGTARNASATTGSNCVRRPRLISSRAAAIGALLRRPLFSSRRQALRALLGKAHRAGFFNPHLHPLHLTLLQAQPRDILRQRFNGLALGSLS